MVVGSRFGPGLCGDLVCGATAEWLVTDGLGGYAMGTVPGLRARRYHGLLMIADTDRPGRHLGLAALDPTVVIGDHRVRLAVDEWQGGVIDPAGHLLLSHFEIEDGVPRWTWSVGDVILQREVAMLHGRPLVAVRHRLVRAPHPIRLELSALCTWRDQHSDRFAGPDPSVERCVDGFVFEGAYRVAGPGFAPAGDWYRGVRYRVEGERGLGDGDDLWHAGEFSAELVPGAALTVLAWADGADVAPPPSESVIEGSRRRAQALAAAAGDDTSRRLAIAADQFIRSGPAVVAGYPWFGEWSRDTMTSFEGLFLGTGRLSEARALLERAASSVSEGMLANTTDTGRTEYNTADGSVWFMHAVGRYIEETGDDEFAHAIFPVLDSMVEHHLSGTRYGIRVDPADGLLTQGAPGCALTWMDARVNGRPVTQRAGKAVEVNALWLRGLAVTAAVQERLGLDSSGIRTLQWRARASFLSRFWDGERCRDVIDGDPLDAERRRPNCLLGVSLPGAPLSDPRVVEGCAPLVSSIGLRSLAPDDAEYRGRHRGSPEQRDRAYHEGTVWPWLMGPYVEAALKTGVRVDGVLDGLEAHLDEWGLGSVSETADGDEPHAATGCPFQAWSVAELLRARRLLEAA